MEATKQDEQKPGKKRSINKPATNMDLAELLKHK